ncbi:MAG: hypothetical protein H6867_02335 [Rhodospirillales bacterium]|nr:hypothetical protein [Rhodospirillales bacterium]MCB9997027.1 hypothetical protein [Rhodospirillales bacterium]
MSLWDKGFIKHLFPGILLLMSLSLPACGFTPLYGTDDTETQGAVATGMEQVYIDNIPDREGQYLRNALIDKFYRSGRPAHPAYTLSIQPIQESRSDLDITKSSDATRAQLRLSTVMTLTEQATGREIMRRKLTSITSYNILQSQFTTRVSEQSTRQNALDDLARQVETQLALYFRHNDRARPH